MGRVVTVEPVRDVQRKKHRVLQKLLKRTLDRCEKLGRSLWKKVSCILSQEEGAGEGAVVRVEVTACTEAWKRHRAIRAKEMCSSTVLGAPHGGEAMRLERYIEPGLLEVLLFLLCVRLCFGVWKTAWMKQSPYCLSAYLVMGKLEKKKTVMYYFVWGR